MQPLALLAFVLALGYPEIHRAIPSHGPKNQITTKFYKKNRLKKLPEKQQDKTNKYQNVWKDNRKKHDLKKRPEEKNK